MDIIDQLSGRGLLHQATDLEGLREHLRSPRRIYCGFDPTAPSLTIGNLVPIIVLSHFQRAGHTPVIVLGGATGMIGDPSGKSTERQFLTKEAIAENLRSQRRIFERLLDFEDKSNGALMFDNAEWLSKMSYLEALREIGKHFSVNEMIKRDSVRERLAREQGISYTEFSYMLLQAWDFKHLFTEHSVTIELGGSDQWGNIVPGIELVRRHCKETVFGVTCPLVTKADGTKFGKTESGPIWLTSERTSAYALYQFFLNTSDEDVSRFLRLFTSLPLEQLAEMEELHAKETGNRRAQKLLAEEVTALIHGTESIPLVINASDCLFSGDITGLPLATLLEVLSGVPTTCHHLSELHEHPLNAAELLVQTVICKSKREARELLNSGAILVNGIKVSELDVFTPQELLHGELLAIRRGKKAWHLARWIR